MAKTYKHIKPIAQKTLNGCWSASMAWWTKAVSTIPNYTDAEIMVEYSHLRGSNGGLTFPTGFRQMLADPKWGMTVEVTTSAYTAMESVRAGLKKAPVMLGFFSNLVGGHHAVVVHAYSSHITTGNLVTIMDPNGGNHVTHQHLWGIGSGNSIIVGYIK
jgi:hypothetical protein